MTVRMDERIRQAMEGRGPMTKTELRKALNVGYGTMDQTFKDLFERGRIRRVERTRPTPGGELWEWGEPVIDRFLARPPLREVS